MIACMTLVGVAGLVGFSWFLVYWLSGTDDVKYLLEIKNKEDR